MARGYLALVLHAHLPYVHHPEQARFLEEDWFYEAVVETYIPLLQVFDGLVRDNIDFRVNFSLSPPLLAMLQSPLLQERCLAHLDRLLELCRREEERTRYQPEFQRLVHFYRERFRSAREYFLACDRNLVRAFARLQDQGFLEVMTSAATHGFLPLLQVNRDSVRAQVQVGVEAYRQAFDRPPRGFWLPECGYYPGLDEELARAGLRYFIVDSHGVLHGSTRARYGVYAPVFCPSGVAAFPRDPESSKQVWSAREGYPGDFAYREFYRDVGFDLDLDYLKEFIHDGQIRVHTGLKYYRITGPGDHKEPYDPDWARARAAEHAGNFMFNRERQVEHFGAHLDRPPLIVAPYDAELFGHWWFEGPEWIGLLYRKLAFDQNTVLPLTLAEYLDRYQVNQSATPAGSSWGYKGYNEYWLNGENAWIWPYLHRGGRRLGELARRYPRAGPLLERALNQAARELLLAESSDWPFIMRTGTTTQYATKRLKAHVMRLEKLEAAIERGEIDEQWLAEVERRDALFPWLDYRVYAGE